MSEQLERLTVEVRESGEAVQQATELIRGLAQEIRKHVDDPAALEALASDLDAQSSTLLQVVGEVAAEGLPGAGEGTGEGTGTGPVEGTNPNPEMPVEVEPVLAQPTEG